MPAICRMEIRQHHVVPASALVHRAVGGGPQHLTARRAARSPSGAASRALSQHVAGLEHTDGSVLYAFRRVDVNRASRNVFAQFCLARARAFCSFWSRSSQLTPGG